MAQDSNPRDPFGPVSFQDCCLRPLGQPSVVTGMPVKVSRSPSLCCYAKDRFLSRSSTPPRRRAIGPGKAPARLCRIRATEVAQCRCPYARDARLAAGCPGLKARTMTGGRSLRDGCFQADPASFRDAHRHVCAILLLQAEKEFCGWPPWTRTTLIGFRIRSPTNRREANSRQSRGAAPVGAPMVK